MNRMTSHVRVLCCAIVMYCTFIIVAIPAAASQGDHGHALPACDNGAGRLIVKDTSIVDTEGKPATLRGMYTRATWLESEADVEQFRQWGITFVRMLLTHDDDYWDVVNEGKIDLEKRCIVREVNLRHMDRRVQWLNDCRIHFMVEVHWRALGISEQFEKPDLLKKQLTRMYAMLADRYKEYDYLMGFCMFSEIYVAPQFYVTYNDICTAIVDAVHEVDSTYIVSATGVQTSSPASLKDVVHIRRPNVIYDFHYYAPKMFTHYRTYYGDLRYPGWVAEGWAPGVELADMDYLKKKLQPVLDFSRKWNVPVWCGEFGAFGDAPDDSSHRWERDVYYLFEKHDIPWILWCWRYKSRTIPEHWKMFWRGTTQTSYVTIVPHGGPFAKIATVRLDCTVDGADIRYTLDGTEPDQDSSVYRKPFQISHDTTVKTAAFTSNQKSTAVDTATFYSLAFQEPAELDNSASGLKYSYYEGTAEQLEYLDLLKPVKTGVAEALTLSPADREDGIALKYEGFIEVPADGLYYFYTSDAGASRLWIGDVLVVNNPTSRWLNRRSGFIALKAGKHALKATYQRADKSEVFYSKDKKNQWFMVEYEGPGLKRQTIPQVALWHVSQNKRE